MVRGGAQEAFGDTLQTLAAQYRLPLWSLTQVNKMADSAQLAAGQRVVVRNAGGVAAATIRVRDGGWYPVLEGNATVVYRAEVDSQGNQAGPLEQAADENAAYAALDERNTAYLKGHRIQTAHP